MLELAKVAELNGVGWTACILGEPIGCAGMAVRSPYFGEPWAIFSPILKDCFAKTLYKLTKRYLEEALAKIAPLPAVSIIDKDNTAGRRFVEHLGFIQTEDWVAPIENMVVYARGEKCHSCCLS